MGGSDKIPLAPQARDDLAEFIDSAVAQGLAAAVNAVKDGDVRSGRVMRMMGGVILVLSFSLLGVVSWTQGQRLDKIEGTVAASSLEYAEQQEMFVEKQAELEKNQLELARHTVALTEAANTNAKRNHMLLLVLVDSLEAEELVPEEAKTLVSIEPSVALRYLAGER